MKPSDKLMAWKREAALDRIEGCRVMLNLHGFVSDAENEKIKQRIRKWVKKNGKVASNDPSK